MAGYPIHVNLNLKYFWALGMKFETIFVNFSTRKLFEYILIYLHSDDTMQSIAEGSCM